MSRPPQILLGVTGGIAAYKSAEILRALVQRGAAVRVAMTRGAREFVAPLTFSVLSGHEVYTEVLAGHAPAVDHVETRRLGRPPSRRARPPRTRSPSSPTASPTISSRPSSWRTADRRCSRPPWRRRCGRSPAVRRNLESLIARGVRTIGPESGFLASGHEGLGRMSEPAAIADGGVAAGQRRAPRPRRTARARHRRADARADRPDPLRLQPLQRQDGLRPRRRGARPRRRGDARERAGRAAGARGRPRRALRDGRRPARPPGARVPGVRRPRHGRGGRRLPAGGLADPPPPRRRRAVPAAHARGATSSRACGRCERGQTIVAFAAETEELEARGRAKLEAKGADLVVVNDVGRSDIGFDADDNEVLILTQGRRPGGDLPAQQARGRRPDPRRRRAGSAARAPVDVARARLRGWPIGVASRGSRVLPRPRRPRSLRRSRRPRPERCPRARCPTSRRCRSSWRAVRAASSAKSRTNIVFGQGNPEGRADVRG